MFLDARALESGTSLRGDVCIIGGGAAGLTLARELSAVGQSVLLLESGGLETDAATLDLQRGTTSGTSYAPLETTRSRFFGGSTNCWAGYCRPLEPIDFEQRDWIPYSGWPIERAELEDDYRRAAELLGLGRGESFVAEDVMGGSLDSSDLLDWSERARFRELGLREGLFRFGAGPLRMGSAYHRELEQDPRVRIVLHANVTRLELEPSGAVLAGLAATALGRSPFTARARRYVLAAGGIENPRLLLGSDDVAPAGVGNDHDCVGRFFMEHPHLRYQVDLVAHSPSRLVRYARRELAGLSQRKILQPTADWLRTTRSLHFGAQIRRLESHGVKPFMEKLAAATRSVDGLGTGAARDPEAAQRFGFVMHHEQAPNPASRITLSDERDALGLRRAHLHWQLGELDRASAGRAHELVTRAIGAAGVGRASRRLSLEGHWPDDMIAGNHHIGTTRMATSPAEGVVDANCRVHGVANLYVAGSSVFPTAGAANPTLTILALTLRLARTLAREA